MRHTLLPILCAAAVLTLLPATAAPDGPRRTGATADGDTTVAIAARITIREGRSRAFLRLCRPLVEQTRREKGCLRYELYRDPHRRNVFFFYEEYADEAARTFHSQQPYMDEYRRRREPMLAEPPSVRTLVPPAARE